MLVPRALPSSPNEIASKRHDGIWAQRGCCVSLATSHDTGDARSRARRGGQRGKRRHATRRTSIVRVVRSTCQRAGVDETAVSAVPRL